MSVLQRGMIIVGCVGGALVSAVRSGVINSTIMFIQCGNVVNSEVVVGFTTNTTVNAKSALLNR